MKKFNYLKQAICLSAILFSIETTNAQVGIGVKGGLNLSKLTIKEENGLTNSFLPGGAGGLVFNFKANDLFSLQPELLYSSQGTHLKTSLFGDFSSKLSTNYFQLPVLAKLSFGSENVRAFVNVGPYAAYLMSAKTKISAMGQEEEVKVDFSEPSVKESANRFDFGIAGGLGVAFKVGPGDLFVEGRYNLGLLDINKGEDTKLPDYKPMKNSVINFSAGYIFFFGGK